MRYVRSFLLIMVVCMHSFYAMQPIERNDILVNIPPRQSLWCNRYSEEIKNIPDIAGLQKLRESLKAQSCLHSNASSLEHLLYLSTISKEGNKSKTLFTCVQQKKFDRAEGIKQWVGRCFWINGVIITAASGFPFVSAVSFLQCVNGTLHDCLSSASTILTPAAVSWFGSMTIGFSSLYATGISPDLSARNADKVQDAISDLRHEYLTIAKYLVDIYFDNDQKKAEDIARWFDIKELTERAQMKTCRKNAGARLITPLEEAVHFIRYKTMLITFTEIEGYIYNKMNAKRIETLEKKILQQKNTKQMKRKKHGKK